MFENLWACARKQAVASVYLPHRHQKRQGDQIKHWLTKVIKELKKLHRVASTKKSAHLEEREQILTLISYSFDEVKWNGCMKVINLVLLFYSTSVAWDNPWMYAMMCVCINVLRNGIDVHLCFYICNTPEILTNALYVWYVLVH